MKKTVKPKRPADPIMRMHSVMQDVIKISNQPIKSPKAQKGKTGQ